MSDDRPQEGLWRRYLFASCARDLEAGRSESTSIVNGDRLSVSEMRALVAYATRWGFLPSETKP